VLAARGPARARAVPRRRRPRAAGSLEQFARVRARTARRAARRRGQRGGPRAAHSRAGGRSRSAGTATGRCRARTAWAGCPQLSFARRGGAVETTTRRTLDDADSSAARGRSRARRHERAGARPRVVADAVRADLPELRLWSLAVAAAAGAVGRRPEARRLRLLSDRFARRPGAIALAGADPVPHAYAFACAVPPRRARPTPTARDRGRGPRAARPRGLPVGRPARGRADDRARRDRRAGVGARRGPGRRAARHHPRGRAPRRRRRARAGLRAVREVGPGTR
jgi:hypothetical protein